MSSNYEINYDDERFAQVEADKNAALNEVDATYGNMISNSDRYFNQQIQASKDWADKQSQLQQEKTDFAIEKIEQQKDQSKKDYTKEQSGAYVDWQKQSNQYGANAEQMAASGMTNTGYSESSQVSMYNTYQNRITAARESYNLAVLNYNNAIKDAQLQNNSILAEIAAEAHQKQLELSLQGFQYKNQLVIEKANKKTEIGRDFYNRYQDVLQQINQENAIAEEIRQFNESMEEEKRQFNEQMAENKRQFNTLHSGSGSGSISKGSGGSSSKTNASAAINRITGGANYKSARDISSSGNSTSGDDARTIQSLIDAGFAGKSAAAIGEAVRAGVLEEYYEDGVLMFRKKNKFAGSAYALPTNRFPIVPSTSNSKSSNSKSSKSSAGGNGEFRGKTNTGSKSSAGGNGEFRGKK